jgi:spore cortex formation protein SpoVR/YcgB (stage V sporulation)
MFAATRLSNLCKVSDYTQYIINTYTSLNGASTSITKIINKTQTLTNEQWNRALRYAKHALADVLNSLTRSSEDEASIPQIQAVNREISRLGQEVTNLNLETKEIFADLDCKAAIIDFIQRRWAFEVELKQRAPEAEQPEVPERPDVGWRIHLARLEQDGVGN